MADTQAAAAALERIDTLPPMPAADALDGDGFPLYRPETVVQLVRAAQMLALAAAAADLERAMRERDEARAALKPFADAFAEPFSYSYRNASPEFAAHLDRNTITPSVTMGAFRRAREVMDGAAAQEASHG